MNKQKTIGSAISCGGIGLHCGELVSIKMKPAPVDHGVVFVRTDSGHGERIPALSENIKAGTNASMIGVNGTRINTVEHVMSALAGLGIDNVEIEVRGPEIPVMDGSAGPFVEMIKTAGIVRQDAPRRWLKVKKTVSARINGSYAEIRPASEPLITASIAFDHPLLRYQSLQTRLMPEEFESEIAYARTFGFMDDVDRLRAMGLARGGSLENVVVIDEHGVVNEDGFRYDDECVRHKILDLAGDLSLLGAPFLGEVVAHKTGHRLNHELMRALIASPDAYEIVEDPPLFRLPSADPGLSQKVLGDFSRAW